MVLISCNDLCFQLKNIHFPAFMYLGSYNSFVMEIMYQFSTWHSPKTLITTISTVLVLAPLPTMYYVNHPVNHSLKTLLLPNSLTMFVSTLPDTVLPLLPDYMVQFSPNSCNTIFVTGSTLVAYVFVHLCFELIRKQVECITSGAFTC